MLATIEQPPPTEYGRRYLADLLDRSGDRLSNEPAQSFGPLVDDLWEWGDGE
jgi:hypothetical protein